jgi:small conductance mechanosensitive channel
MNFDLAAPIKTIQEQVNGFLGQIPTIIFAIVVFSFFYFLGKIIRSSVRKIVMERRKQNIGLVMGRLAQVLTVFLGGFVAAGLVFPSISAQTIIQVLGVGSVAIGFAFRDVLQNFLAGILILLNEPFEIGDEIRFKDFEGRVEDIQTRATLLRTYDGRRVVIPNASLFIDSVTINTAFDSRRSEVVVGIGFGDDALKAEQIILDTLGKIEGVLKNPAPDTVMKEIGASSMNITARWWTKPSMRDVLHVQDEVVIRVKKALLDAGIDLPFPTQQILFHDQTDEFDGDRTRQREGWPAKDGRSPKQRNMASALRDVAESLSRISESGPASRPANESSSSSRNALPSRNSNEVSRADH